MANAWFRLYSEFAHDPKVQTMPFPMQRHLVMLFCLRCEGKSLEKFGEEEIAFFLHVTPLELSAIKSSLLQKGFIDESWEIVNWDKRQYISDTSTNRVRQYRQRMKQDGTLQKRDGTQNETAPDTEQIQNRYRTEQKQQELTLLSPEATKPKIRPEDFGNSWNTLRGKLAKITEFSESRKKKVQTRMKQGLTLERFEQAVRCCTEKPFLRGENKDNWEATFDWLIENDKNIDKAINNDYGSYKKTINGGNHATVPNGTGGKIMGVLKETLERRQRDRTASEDGDLPTSGEAGSGNSRTLHAISSQSRLASLSSGDEKSFLF